MSRKERCSFFLECEILFNGELNLFIMDQDRKEKFWNDIEMIFFRIVTIKKRNFKQDD